MTLHEAVDVSRNYPSGLYWRLQTAGLDPVGHQSWPWGLTREEAEQEGQLLDGVSCCSAPEDLLAYWDGRGGADGIDEYEVVVLRGVDVTPAWSDGSVVDVTEVVLRATVDELREAVA